MYHNEIDITRASWWWRDERGGGEAGGIIAVKSALDRWCASRCRGSSVIFSWAAAEDRGSIRATSYAVSRDPCSCASSGVCASPVPRRAALHTPARSCPRWDHWCRTPRCRLAPATASYAASASVDRRSSPAWQDKLDNRLDCSFAIGTRTGSCLIFACCHCSRRLSIWKKIPPSYLLNLEKKFYEAFLSPSRFLSL